MLRGKNMDVASMDALKKRIEVRAGQHVCSVSIVWFPPCRFKYPVVVFSAV